MNVKIVSVIGVTGTMGSNIAGIFASFGYAKVYCIGRNKEKVNKVIDKIVSSVKADCIRERLIPSDFSDLARCIAESDIIFESSVEDLETKKKIASIVSKYMGKSAISCTGTSGLSINELANSYSDEQKGKFFGVHLFNPPYNMPLCELVLSRYSNKEIADELRKYLSNTLLRTVVDVEDSPAFLANRIGFQFINEALQYAEKYKNNGGIDYIDSILGTFTGRAMPPIETSDFVGLDIHKAIVDNIFSNIDDYAKNTFILPDYVGKLIGKNNLGRKSGIGLYKQIKFDDGTKKIMVYDILTDDYREKILYKFPFAESIKNDIANGEYNKAFKELLSNHSMEAEICVSFLLKYIVYSLYCANKVTNSLHSADDVMATGFNWCPPLALVDLFSSVTDVVPLIHTRIPDICAKVNVDKLLLNIPKSKYDCRSYFKSGERK